MQEMVLSWWRYYLVQSKPVLETLQYAAVRNTSLWGGVVVFLKYFLNPFILCDNICSKQLPPVCSADQVFLPARFNQMFDFQIQRLQLHLLQLQQRLHDISVFRRDAP